MSKKVLSSREDRVVNTLRKNGYTINEVANIFGVSRDVVRNACPERRAYIKKYNQSVCSK